MLKKLDPILQLEYLWIDLVFDAIIHASILRVRRTKVLLIVTVEI